MVYFPSFFILFNALSCIKREFFASHSPITYVDGFVRVSFDRDVVELGHFQQEICIFSFFTSMSRVPFITFFFRDVSVKFLDITFSIVNRDRFVMS